MGDLSNPQPTTKEEEEQQQHQKSHLHGHTSILSSPFSLHSLCSPLLTFSIRLFQVHPIPFSSVSFFLNILHSFFCESGVLFKAKGTIGEGGIRCLGMPE